MKILIELPTWLGDGVMTTPAIENLLHHYGEAEVYLVGSFISVEALKNNPKVIKTYVLDKNFLNTFKVLQSLEEFDVFFSFRGSFRARLMKLFIKSKVKYQFNKNIYLEGHQVEKYNNFINESLKINSIPNSLKLNAKNKKEERTKKLLGLNPGASYGSAKRWHPRRFSEVAIELSTRYDIIIFGGVREKEAAKNIEKYLIEMGVNNYQNLASITTINELISQIANLDILITGDSGPMHLAAALQIPTVAIFGPTNHDETSQWMNKKSIIVKKNLECQPCMKRTCPLKHHNCMRLIEPSEVLEAVNRLN
jgi:heptosyltransferase II